MDIIDNGNCMMISNLQRDKDLELPSIVGNDLREYGSLFKSSLSE